ncbi:MAG: apolipoprotein N-acyltransferase [Thermoguttaceae bacterium]|jgi:apolipoprotein N-acyltransferase|nr:apolipoprotein N-acyltransferase [Thermoguttaceae bacterium]
MANAEAPWYRSTLGQAGLSAGLLWAALPPLGNELWPLAWVAPVGWVLLVRCKEMPGRRPYRALWLVGFLFWMAALHWLRLPHPATSIGWVALSFYFSFYLPVFVALSRVAVHRLGLSVIVATPVAWTGLELLRGHLLGGMTMASLGHTQYLFPPIIQISDLAGAYGVSFLIMLVAACLARVPAWAGQARAAWPLAIAATALAGAFAYGWVRMSEVGAAAAPTLRVAIIQGSIDTELTADPQVRVTTHNHYVQLTEEAVRRHRDIDLILWPETVFRDPLISVGPGAAVPDYLAQHGISQSEFERRLREELPDTLPEMTRLATQFGVPMILGVEQYHYGPAGQKRFNCAAMVTADGVMVRPVYAKMHPVAFGEYIPFADRFPLLQQMTPLASNLSAGDQPVAFELGGLLLAPSICYESVLPHLIGRQIRTLAAEGREPDILVNLTNDGWFWGSSELDMHLACGVFRAVEARKPLVIAANTGFSAWIDGDGRLLLRGRRRDTDILLAEVSPDHRGSLYLRLGDWFARLCLAGCVVLAAVGLAHGRSRQFRPENPS